MKKLLGLGLVSFTALAATGCSKKYDLKILNWDDYINPELVDAFRAETGLKVLIDTADSNEKMKAKVSEYDILIPSEYTIDELRQTGKIQELDFTKLENFKATDLDPLVTKLLSDAHITNYTVPYQMGTIGLMYNPNNSVIKAALTADANADLWDMFFNANSGIRRGMYDSSRDAIASALIASKVANGVNTVNESELQAAVTKISNGKFTKYATDELKRNVADGDLDMALVYSGDYFETLFLAEEEGEWNADNLAFWTSNNTNVFLDGYVISKDASHVDNAYKFIDFMLDTETNAENTDFIGYCSPFTPVFNKLITEYDYADYEFYHPAYPTGGNASADRTSEAKLAKLQVYTYSANHTTLLQDYFNRINRNM